MNIHKKQKPKENKKPKFLEKILKLIKDNFKEIKESFYHLIEPTILNSFFVYDLNNKEVKMEEHTQDEAVVLVVEKEEQSFDLLDACRIPNLSI